MGFKKIGRKFVSGLLGLGLGFGLAADNKPVDTSEVISQLNNPTSVEQVSDNSLRNIDTRKKKVSYIYPDKVKVSKKKPFKANQKVLSQKFKIKSFNPNIYDGQRRAIYNFLLKNHYYISNKGEEIVKKYLSDEKVYEGKDFRFDKINERLSAVLYELSKPGKRGEDVNPRVAFAIAFKETIFGKKNAGKYGLGPL